MTECKIGDRTYALMVDRIAESEGKVDQLAGLNADLMLANKALRARVAELEAENKRLLAFAADVVRNFWESSLEGDEIQELGVKHGLLVREQRTVPCGDACSCAEYYDRGDEAECYRYTPEVAAALAGKEGE